MNPSNVLIIYTGGTIGMIEDQRTGSLIPLDFDHIQEHVPELQRFHANFKVVSFDPPIDSSEVNVETWKQIARTIERHYSDNDGFVVLHGTDTMAYTASALSFMFKNLAKPVILTGSQLPIGKLRTDGKENLITAIEIALAKKEGEPIVQEVAVCFESKLFRGNRTHKYNTEDFAAFKSANFPPLAEIGIHIFYRHDLLLRPNGGFKVSDPLETHVGILRIFPGITPSFLQAVLNAEGLKGLILETYGSGNGPQEPWFIEALQKAIASGIVIVNITQCNEGFVEQGRYKTSSAFVRIGVIGGADMTTEAGLTKLMFLLGQESDKNEIERNFVKSQVGELTSFSSI